MKETIGAIHSRGVARLDIDYVNVVMPVSIYDKPAIIDLGSAWFEYEVSGDSFRGAKSEDFENLEAMFSCWH